MKSHPIRDFINSGIKVSVNSDDPPMFGTDMNNEYTQLNKELGFSVHELHKIGLDSIETSFIHEEKKERLRNLFQKKYWELT